MTPSPWSPRVLTGLVSALGDPETGFDMPRGLAHIASALGAEIAGLTHGATVVAVHGAVGDHADVVGELIDRAAGDAHVAVARLEPVDGALVVSRSGSPFDADERELLAAIGALVGMALGLNEAAGAERAARDDLQKRADDNRRLLGQLRERQGLLDRLHRIEQSISHRLPTQEVLDAITDGARDLLGVERAGIWLRDDEADGAMTLVSHTGSDGTAARGDAVDIADRIPPEVFDDGRLAVRYDLGDASHMSTAIEVDGVIVGCLSVGDRPDHRFSPPEQEALLALARHASLALHDARASDAMRKSLERERHRARHDGLRSLPNRATVRAELAHLLAHADGRATTVLFVDLDRFKLANDTLGHAFGDEVLTVVADRLRTAVREDDLVGRLSGDEFVVVCQGVGSVGAVEFAERLQQAIGRPIAVGDITHVITASIGIAEAAAGQTADEVLADADLAMYRAKQGGRARIDVFDDQLRSQVADRLSVGQGLRRAIDAEEFVVHLQPLVELPARRVTGFEALVRWEHPTRGLLAPGAFLPAAEELGLIADIDRFVLREAVGLLGRHRSARPIAVNLSVRSFGDPGLCGWLRSLLDDHGVLASRVSIEVTETVLMDQEGMAATQIQALRDLGVGVMIDDFGTGYSSLSYLQAFDVDGVKIDRSFIARLADDPRAEAIVGAVLSVAEALDLPVVAEGIEADDQVDRLISLADRFPGVALTGQGFLFGRPAEADSRLAGFVEVPVDALAR